MATPSLENGTFAGTPLTAAGAATPATLAPNLTGARSSALNRESANSNMGTFQVCALLDDRSD
jgi:hypothetical protein